METECRCMEGSIFLPIPIHNRNFHQCFLPSLPSPQNWYTSQIQLVSSEETCQKLDLHPMQTIQHQVRINLLYAPVLQTRHRSSQVWMSTSQQDWWQRKQRESGWETKAECCWLETKRSAEFQNVVSSGTSSNHMGNLLKNLRRLGFCNEYIIAHDEGVKVKHTVRALNHKYC